MQRTWKCNNPGAQQSFCESKVEQLKLQQCSASCSNGRCLNIRCTLNSDCNDNNTNTTDICNLPGTEQSFCSNNNNIFICYSDLDCGIDTYISQNICNGNKVTKLFQDFSCNNPGTMQSFCSSVIRQDTLQICDFTCSNGQCVQPQGECTPGQTRLCGNSNVGVCEFGVQTCQANGFYGNCVGNIDPSTEICDGADNNCDSQIDENNVCQPACTNECNNGEKQCSGNGYKTCGNFDSDSCLEFSSAITNCASNQICSNGQCVNQQIPECRDSIDNDHDGFIDYPADLGCSNNNDDSELPINLPPVPKQCDDGIDNDGDNLIDFPADPGCTSRTDNSEIPVNNPPAAPQCDDGIDNDNDRRIDYPADAQCSNRLDNSE